MKLAHEIVSIYQNEQAAEEAEQAFVRVFQERKEPAEMPEFQLIAGQSVLDVLMAGGMVSTKSDGRRMLEQDAVRLDGETLKDANIAFPHAGVLQVGKRRFLRVK